MKHKLSQLKENIFIRGGIIFTAANFIVGILNYLFHSISAKALGPSMYSEIAALFSYIALFTIPLGIVGNLIIQRLGYAGIHREAVASGLKDWLDRKRTTVMFCSVGLLLTAFIIPHITKISLATSITLVILVLLTFFITFYNALAQGLSLFYIFGLASIVISLVKFSGALFAYAGFYPLSAIYITLILGFAAQYLIMRFSVVRHISRTKNTTYEFRKKLSSVLHQRYVIISIISLVTFTLLSNADIIYVKRFFEAKDAGIYSAWSLFAKVITYVTGPLFSVLFIFFARQEHLNKKSYMYFSIFLLSIASLCAYILYISFGSQLVLIMFNEEYMPIRQYLGKAALFGYLYAVINAMNYYFVARRKSASLVIPYTVLLYLLGLWIYGRTLEAVMNINLVYSFAIVAIYIVVFIKEKPSSSAS